MIQYSIYGRITRNHDDTRKHVERLKRNTPKRGSVRVMTVTEKQYGSMQVLVGEKTATENFLTPNELIEL
jgi:CRISPR-associated protein Cas2